MIAFNTGFYRLCSSTTPGAVWEEGTGYVVYDDQAQREGQLAMLKRNLAHWEHKLCDAEGHAKLCREQVERARADLATAAPADTPLAETRMR